MANRLGVIVWYLLRQRAVLDNLLFVALMSTLFWFMSMHAGFTLTRHGSPWAVMLPGGLAIVLIQNYDTTASNRIGYLLFYLFLALTLVARQYFIGQRRRWIQTRTFLPSYLGVDIIRFAVIACLVVITLSWSTPAVARAIPAAKQSWDRVVTPWWNDFRNVFENAFASLRSTMGMTGDYYGPNLSLGRGSVLSDTVVFTVQTPLSPPEGIRYYWRARVYDTFQNGWISSLLTTRALDAQEIDLDIPDMLDNPPGSPSFTFYINRPLATIFSPNQITWISRPTRAELAFNPDGSADIGMIRASPSLRAGEIYSVRASFNDSTATELRNAGTIYPDWVTARYLQLPSSTTLRTRQLAAQIAQGLTNPYDIAQAVTQYLRENYKYTETVPGLPTNQDLVDWFLFDLKEGFCNYYATAEVILLRINGIPARLAVGYARGDNVDNPEFYTVRQRDAHAWPEVYFPDVGWIEFEPTVSQPLLVRPDDDFLGENADEALDTQALRDSDLVPPDPQTGGGNLDAEINPYQRWLPVILAASLSIVLLALLLPFVQRKQLHKKIPLLPIVLEKAMRRAGLHPPRLLIDLAFSASLSPLERAYQQINLALQRLDRLPAPMNTPAERAAALSRRLPPATQPANVVLTEYQRATYSPKPIVDLPAAQQAGDEIRRLSLRALIRRRFGI
jgi:transglutaminase-like putative cysteine protease